MRHILVVIVAFASLIMLPASDARAIEDDENAGCIIRAELAGMITSADARYVQRAVNLSERAGCQATLLVVDSPGGDLEATRRLVEALLRARAPVIAYVPEGGHAGAASALVVLASHVAALAPEASLGFGNTVKPPGGSGAVGEHAALARFLASHRDRNASWAESAVYEQRSAHGEEAQLIGAVDLVAADEAAVLEALDGRRLAVLGASMRLDTGSARVTDAPLSMRHIAARALSEPNLIYALLMIGVLGVLLELFRPGLLVPGLVGTGALLVSAFGLHLLPIDVVALLLLVVAVVLFGAELRFKGFGAFTVGGVVALLLGSLRLLNAHHPAFFLDVDPHVSWGAVLPVTVALGGVTAVLAHASAQRRHAAKGR